MAGMRGAIAALGSGREPDEAALRDAFDALMEGEADPVEIGGFLLALSALGESPKALRVGAQSMRARMTKITAPDGAIDTCGTGGDARGTWNISTAAALVAAGAGAVVAKHGNKAASSKSGSAEVLESLGVNLFASPAQIEQALAEARAHHGAVRHVGPARRTLGVRTVFNLLGPLSNPAGARRQLLGVFDRRWLTPMAEALRELGAQTAMIVHGSDGLDEITTTGATHVAELKADGSIETYQLNPADAGLETASLDDLQGGEPEENAEAIRGLLAGVTGPYRDIVLFNAGAALKLAGLAEDFTDGARQAARAIDDGHAATALESLVAASHAAQSGEA